jgi:CMP-N,N'-diacetyllegionaminic acid synthase
MRVLALIAARRGSKGLRDKNIRVVGRAPLLARAVLLARRSRRRGEEWTVVVSTDSPRYAAIARAAGAEIPFLRPAKLARDTAELRHVVLHALDELARQGRTFDVVVLLSATTPLTTSADVRAALGRWRRRGGSVISVTPDLVPAEWRLKRRGTKLVSEAGGLIGRRLQRPQHYQVNGAIYIAAPKWLRRYQRFFVSGRTHAHIMPPERGLDIETAQHLRIARALV